MKRLEVVRTRIMEEEKINNSLYEEFCSATGDVELLQRIHKQIIVSNLRLKILRDEESLLMDWGE